MKKIYLSTCLIAFSTLLLEITLTRIYSVLFFYNFAFMIISTALFGYGLSAVWLIIFFNKLKGIDLLKLAALFFSISIIILMVGLSYIPVSFSHYPLIKRIPLLSIHYIILILPFFFSGVYISSVFTKFSIKIAKLYFFDLLGAAIGSISILLLIKNIGAQGLLFICALLSFIIFLILNNNNKLKYISIIIIIPLLFFVPKIEKYFPITPHRSKSAFHHHLKNKMIIYSKWSAITKIDVAASKPMWILWIDGGTNESFIPVLQHNKAIILSYKDITSIPYKLIKNPSVLIIGSSGGWEVKVAKNLSARKIIAVEMDQLIVEVVKNTFSKEINYLFQQPNIQLITNEGRNYLHNSKEKFDIIQEINNQTSVAIASGALNLSETYLLTKEALLLYWNHLNDNGILSVWKWGIERLFSSYITILEEKGIQEPYKHIIILHQNDEYQKLFLLKKAPFSYNEIKLIEQLCKQNNWKMLFNPLQPFDNPFFSKMLNSSNIIKLSKETGINLMPATDNKPFFNHFLPIWQKHVKMKNNIPEETIKKMENVSATERYTLGIIFLQSLFFSTVFLILPIFKFTKEKISNTFKYFIIIYFSALGIGFILLEIVMMQKFVLFLGHPAYSISMILFSILISAGIGSFISEILISKLGIKKHIVCLFISLLLLIILYLLTIDFIISKTMDSNIMLRIMISFLLVFLLGFLLGMPFPTGLSLIASYRPKIIAWAWGLNAYMTVIGSMVSIFIAISFGFHSVIFIAFICYFAAFIAILKFNFHLSG
jgi:hypothetical protein